MSISKRLVCGSICAVLAASVVVAQPTTQTIRMTGNLVGANASVSGPDYQAYVSISPEALPGNNQELYNVYWNVTVYAPPGPVGPPPNPPDMVSTSVNALVQASAIQSSKSGGLSVDLDIGKAQMVYSSSVQCIAGTCQSIPPPITFPLKGTFTPLTAGPGTYSSSVSGHQYSISVDPVCRFETSFSGHQTEVSARFAGQIGDITAPEGPGGSNASLYVLKGQTTRTTACTPPQPPM